MARRWAEFAGQILVASDVDIGTKGKALWTDAMNDPATSKKLALHREIFRFVEQAIAYLKTLTK